MASLAEVAPAFVEMAHRVVWCSAATVDAQGRPRSRVLHPIWDWDGARLTGWIATAPTPTKRAHLAASAHLSAIYWAPSQDTCVADCRASFVSDDATRTWLWHHFKNAPAPVGYDPAIIPGWTGPLEPSFIALKLDPWRLRVQPASVMMGKGGAVLTWREASA
jgi:hypothetical protein